MTKYQIECNYRLALKRADELSETARNIMKVSENISNDVMAGLEADVDNNLSGETLIVPVIIMHSFIFGCYQYVLLLAISVFVLSVCS